MTQKLEYINQGRSGYILYKDTDTEFRLFFEMCGGDCIVAVCIPTIDEWISKTNKPLSERINILTFIAKQLIKDQAPNCTYILSDRFIEVMKQ